MKTEKPDFLLEDPIPVMEERLYNGQPLRVWEGDVKISSIHGWVENPRIELARNAMQNHVGDRDLTEDEVFDLMKNDPEVRLKDLRDDIIKNGLREPLTLSFQGRLLDGNRRFFAIKYALENMPSAAGRRMLETVPAIVLNEDATAEDEENVLVEENFSASLKIEWPDYVKARRVIQAYEEDGMSIAQISEKFGWDKRKVKETIRINEVIHDFEIFATDPPDLNDEYGGGLGLSEQEAQIIASKYYQYFNEAQRNFFEPLKTNVDFKIQFFKWVKDGKFSSLPEARIAHHVWSNPEAKAAIAHHEPGAAKAAKAIIDYNLRVSKSTEEAAGRIETFVKFLKDLTAEEMKSIPDLTKEKLEAALGLVIKMSRAASEK